MLVQAKISELWDLDSLAIRDPFEIKNNIKLDNLKEMYKKTIKKDSAEWYEV